MHITVSSQYGTRLILTAKGRTGGRCVGKGLFGSAESDYWNGKECCKTVDCRATGGATKCGGVKRRGRGIFCSWRGYGRGTSKSVSKRARGSNICRDDRVDFLHTTDYACLLLYTRCRGFRIWVCSGLNVRESDDTVCILVVFREDGENFDQSVSDTFNFRAIVVTFCHYKQRARRHGSQDTAIYSMLTFSGLASTPNSSGHLLVCTILTLAAR